MRDLVRKAIDGLEQSGRLVSILQRENTQDSLSASVAAGLARIRARLVVRLMAALVAAVTRSRLNSLAFHLVFAHHSHLVAEYLELVAPSTCLVVYTRTK